MSITSIYCKHWLKSVLLLSHVPLSSQVRDANTSVKVKTDNFCKIQFNLLHFILLNKRSDSSDYVDSY